ncbi:hypothetical protein ACM66B_003884 [Microbotryomycetes sp. NB124-2]
MRRLDALEDESLPDLPELPTMSENEYTLPDSPQQLNKHWQGGMSRLLSPGAPTDTPRAASSTNNNNTNDEDDDGSSSRQRQTLGTPYTSTPATTSTLSDRTAMPMTVTTQRTTTSSTNTTSSEATVRPPTAHAHQRQQLLQQQLPAANLHLLDDGDEDDSLQQANATRNDNDRDDDMVILSGESGTDSDHRQTNAHRPQHQLGVPESARARRLSAASANISTRRKAGRASSASAVTAADTTATRHTDYAAQTPLRPRDVNDLTLPTPELGRHQSPVALSDSFPSLSTPHATVDDLKLPSFATPGPRGAAAQVSLDLTPPATLKLASPEAQRRANHVLTTLRSTAKSRIVRGTPHPRRPPLGAQLVDTPKPGAIEDTDESDAPAQAVEADLTATSSSSSDLTNLHARGIGGSRRANTSLPTAVEAADPDTRPATGARFNGAKLNAYLHQLNTHLSDENKTLSKELDESRQEVGRLREESLALSRMDHSNSSGGGSVAMQQLRDELNKARQEAELAKRTMHDKVAQLTSRVDDLLVDLEDKDRELEDARKHVDEQEGEFADKMQKLEEELCRVMEEQEQGVEQARKDVEAKRQADEAYWQAESAKLEETRTRLVSLERELEAVTNERDQLKRVVDDSSADSDADTARESRIQLSQMRTLVAELQAKLEAAEASDEQARQLIAEHADNLKQTEEALDESARQLVQTEEEMQSLRQQLASEKNVVSSLKAQISQLSLTKAKSPLANEAFNADKDAVIQSMEEELEQAHKQVSKLKDELGRRSSARQLVEAQEEQIKTLESHKVELEGRVNQLKQQSIQTSPLRTPEKSMLFRSILGLKTPRTPGQFLANMTAWTPASGDTTITPLLAQIEELELEKERLIEQLNSANDNVDDKLNKLERAGSGTLSLVRELAEAKARIARLEAELDRLIGRHGLLKRARTRLSNLTCPSCATLFDANKVVQLRLDESGDVSVASFDALGQALSSINEHIRSWPSDRDARLVSDSETAIQQQFAAARDAILDIEADFGAERERSSAMAEELDSSNRERASVESRLAAADSGLLHVKRDLAQAKSREMSERLRTEKDELVSERADLLQKLAAIDARVNRATVESGASRTTNAELKAQLDDNLRLVARLRDELASNANMSPRHRDEVSAAITRLQTDLQSVRQACVDLATTIGRLHQTSSGQRDLASELDKLRDELRSTKRKLDVYEDKVTNHVCSTDSTIMIDLKERHALESKGLLALVKYFKRRVERESSFRSDLSYQKGFLQATLQDKQEALDVVSRQLGLPRFDIDGQRKRSCRTGKHKLTFKAVALSVIAVNRMRSLSENWKAVELTKVSMRQQSYPQVRGRPFPG